MGLLFYFTYIYICRTYTLGLHSEVIYWIVCKVIFKRLITSDTQLLELMIVKKKRINDCNSKSKFLILLHFFRSFLSCDFHMNYVLDFHCFELMCLRKTKQSIRWVCFLISFFGGEWGTLLYIWYLPSICKFSFLGTSFCSSLFDMPKILFAVGSHSNISGSVGSHSNIRNHSFNNYFIEYL